MNDGPSGGRFRPRRPGLLAVTVATATLLAAGCGGGSPRPGSSSHPGGVTVQKIDSFAQCMRNHGIANFYLSPRGSQASSPPPGTVVLSILGYQVTGVNPQTQQFQLGMKSCRKLLGLRPPSPAVQHQQLAQDLKAAACMRANGYPSWQDPSGSPDGGIYDPGPPAGVDTSSPQYIAAAKKCGES